MTFLKLIWSHLSSFLATVKQHGKLALGIALALLVLYGGYTLGVRSQKSTIASLTEKLAESEQTVELKQGLYATTLEQVSNLDSLLAGNSTQIAALKKQLSDSQAQLLTTQQVAVQWQKAYQGAVKATQTDGGSSVTPPSSTTPVEVPVGRDRVDFTGNLGPIAATGYTLTNPAYAYLSIAQVKPLTLTVSVAKEKDGTWTSFVTADDPNVAVNVKLGGVDPGVLAPLWYQRIWVDAGIDALGSKRASIGAHYQFDRWSLGFSCSLEAGLSAGCGVTGGFRPFQ